MRHTAPEGSYWWLSFADETGFLGGAIVGPQCFGMIGAVAMAHDLGINPGGEVRGADLGGDISGQPFPVNALLSKEDINRVDTALRWDGGSDGD